MIGRWLAVVWVAACAGGESVDDETSAPDETDGVDTDVPETDVAPVDTDETDLPDSDTDNIGVWDTADTGDSDGPVDDDGDGWSARADCDDDDPTVFPGAPEVCDGVDEDCGGDGDGTVATFLPVTGPAEDVTTLLQGTTSSPRSYTVDRAGALFLCGGPWYARLTVTADGAQVGGVPGAEVPPVLDATAAPGAYALRVDADDVVVTDVDLTRRDGRVVDIASDVSGLSLRSVSLAGGSVADDGACLRVGADADVAGDVVLFKDCMADGDGGAAFVSSGASLQLTGATARTVVAARGGAIAVAAGGAFVGTDGDLSGRATSRGGVVFASGGDVTLDGTVLRDGRAPEAGGLWADGAGASVALSDTTVIGCNGRAVVLEGVGGATLVDVDVLDSVTAASGASVDVRGATSLTWTGGAITAGASGDGGGGLHVVSGTVSLTDVSVSDGTAAHGGGLWVEGGTVSLTDCVLDGNATSGVGGGVEVSGGSVTLTTSSVLNGSASTGGGAYVSGGTLSLVSVDLGTGGSDNTPNDLITSGGGSEGALGVVSLTCTASGCD